ncbi:MAG TPA: hypothetical protein PLP16_12340 [Smithellaceae bacterium]|nr:hypothetical protein [Smithellaceae bacterium]
MFGKENEQWEQFDELAKIIENVPRKQPPEDFTAKVMAKISCQEETAPAFSLGRLFTTNLQFGFPGHATKTECAFYFLITGFFYFILGLIMMIGLPLPAIMPKNSWLSFQPLFGLLLAAELIAIGVVLYRKGGSAVCFVRLGTLLYAVLLILNCWIGALYIQPPTVLFFIAVFSMTGLVFAVLLGLAIHHYHPANIFSEARG